MRKFRTLDVGWTKHLLVLGIVLLALGCNLGSTAEVTIATTTPVPSILSVPLVAVNPVYGPPGTNVTLTTAGFAAGTPLKVYVSSPDDASSSPVTAVTATAGITTLTVPLPQEINGTTIANGTPLLFTLTSTTGGPNATALFWVQGPGTSATTATAISGGQIVPTAQGGGVTTGVFITAPPINSAVAGSNIAVAGSAPAGAVTVQIQGANNNVLGSEAASSQATTGTLGVWQTTVAFTPPAAGATGFIVAIQGDQQASIPVTFTGGTTIGSGTLVVPATLIFATPNPGVQIGITP